MEFVNKVKEEFEMRKNRFNFKSEELNIQFDKKDTVIKQIEPVTLEQKYLRNNRR
jgi:hypothetical protein